MPAAKPPAHGRSMRLLPQHLLPVLLLLLAACAPQAPQGADELRDHARGMNLLLVVLDAANAEHFSFMGYERATTPNIDRLAAEGVVFRSAWSQASATPLSMYSMMTSRYPILSADEFVETGELAAVIPPTLPTLASWASQRYDARGAFVANRWMREELGFHHGWSSFEKIYDQVPLTDLPVPANLVTDSFASWLDGNPGSPWLAWLHYLEPHDPYTPPEPWASRFDPSVRGFTDGTSESLGPWREEIPGDDLRRNTIALYDGNLAFADAEFGRVVQDLKERGEWDRTIVVLTSDHGEAFWEHGVRGHGLHVYEEFVHVPLIVRVPGLAPRSVEGAVELVDLVPTLLDLADVFVPVGSAAGQSLVEVLTGESRPSDIAFARNHRNGFIEVGVRRGPLKYHAMLQEKRVELYNLDADPAEQHNLIPMDEPLRGELRTLAIGMQNLVDQWIEGGNGTGDGFDPALTGADSLDADTIEALRAIGYFGN